MGQSVCNRCNYQLDGLAAESACPECGATAAQRAELDAQATAAAQQLTWRVCFACAVVVMLGVSCSCLSMLVTLLDQVWGL